MLNFGGKNLPIQITCSLDTFAFIAVAQREASMLDLMISFDRA